MTLSLLRALALTSAFLVCPGAHSDNTEVTINAGEQLTLVFVKNKEGGEAARERYLSGAFTLAKEAGMRSLIAFPVTGILHGEQPLDGVGLYAFPDKVSAQRLRANDTYLQQYVPLRKAGWESLEVIDVDIDEAVQFSLNEDYSYTIAKVWLADPARYDRYYEGTQPLREALGATFLLKLNNVRMDGVDAKELPDFIALVEWPDAHAPARYTEAPLFKQYEADVQAGIQRLEWYQLGFY